MSKEVVLSGIRATGRLHVGSFLGAVRHFVDYQNKPNTKCLFFVADFHSLTTLRDPDELRSNVLPIVIDYLAAGLDPEKSSIYVQSSVPEVTELAWYLGTLQPVGDLLRMPTYKDKIERADDNNNAGTLTYPVLMAADIIGPRATLVPVGLDQVVHVELARNLAGRFNTRYGGDLPIPNVMEEMIKVPGLDGGKMGKSDAKNAIGIDSARDQILQQYLRHGITDENRKRVNDPGNPENCRSVYPVHRLVTKSEPVANIASSCKAGTIGCKTCKGLLADSLWEILGPFQEKRREIEANPSYVTDVLREGGVQARERIRATTEMVREKMGIVRY